MILGPTPPPTSENEIDLTELYRRHPQLWQGFVTIKKHAAMVQLHYLSGDKILGMLFIYILPWCKRGDFLSGYYYNMNSAICPTCISNNDRFG